MNAVPSAAQMKSKSDWRHAFRLISPTFRIREERGGDTAAREALLDASFGPARFAKTCERLREGRRASGGLSFVAVGGSVVVGTVRLWDIEIGDQASLMLGPLAVDPAMRSAGIGAALTEHAIRRARKMGHDSIILVGDAPYYARFGFEAAATGRMIMPGPVDAERLLGLELKPGALRGAKGRVVGAGAFAVRRDEDGSRRAA